MDSNGLHALVNILKVYADMNVTHPRVSKPFKGQDLKTVGMPRLRGDFVTVIS